MDDDIEFFFHPPNTPSLHHQRNGQFSVLYLLRRELLETLGFNPDTEDESSVWTEGPRHRLFASLILTFTAIDLLAKFHQGAEGGVGQRFRAFLTSWEGAQIGRDDAELLWAVRNSLVHSFSGPDSETLSRLGMSEVVIAQRLIQDTSMGEGHVFVRSNGVSAVIYIDGVYRLLVSAINTYHMALFGSEETALRPKFGASFRRFGTLRVSADELGL